MGYRWSELTQHPKSRVPVFCAWTIWIADGVAAVLAVVWPMGCPYHDVWSAAAMDTGGYAFLVGAAAWLVYLGYFVKENWIEERLDSQFKWWVLVLPPIAVFMVPFLVYLVILGPAAL